MPCSVIASLFQFTTVKASSNNETLSDLLGIVLRVAIIIIIIIIIIIMIIIIIYCAGG